jgi:hypothetical protein
MNYCDIKHLNCPYKLSNDSPLPCFATQEQCDKLTKEIQEKEIPKPTITNPLTKLEL